MTRMSSLRFPRISAELLWNLTLRELRGKYRRSFLGWSWSLLNPLSLVIIYGFVFGVVFGSTAPIGDPSGVQNYSLYLLSGILPWGFFNLITALGLGSLIGNGGLIRKVALSRETLVLAQTLFSFVQFSIEIALLIAIFTIAGSAAIVWLPVTFLLMIMLAAFATGIGLVLSVVAVYFRDLTYLWTIVMQIFFFTTPIIYDDAALEGRVSAPVLTALQWNPMAVFIRSFRHSLYDGSFPPISKMLYLAGVSIVSLIVGFVIFQLMNKRIAEEI